MNKSELKLTGNFVTKSNLSVNTTSNYDESKDKDIRFSLNKTFGVARDDTKKARLILNASIFDENYVSNGEPFHVEVEIMFFFEVDTTDVFKNEDILDKYALSMIGIAFPYIRAHISALSGLSGMKDIINIPPIDVSTFFEED